MIGNAFSNTRFGRNKKSTKCFVRLSSSMRAQQAADVGRIEPKPTSEFPNARPLFSDLPQEPCFAKRMVSAQEVIVEYTNALCHGPIEAPNLFNQWHIHEDLQACSISN